MLSLEFVLRNFYSSFITAGRVQSRLTYIVLKVAPLTTRLWKSQACIAEHKYSSNWADKTSN